MTASYIKSPIGDVKVASLLNCSVEEVVDVWGLPGYMDGESLEYKEISVSLSNDKVSSISGFAEDFAIGSSWLCMTKDEIIQTLGEPDSELDHSYYTDLVYSAPDCELVITITESGYAEYLVISIPSETSNGFLSDDYVGYDDSSSHGNSGNNANLDYNLCGRWRSYSGKAFTLDEYGNASTSWKVWDYLHETPISLIWSVENGRLNFIAQFQFEYSYQINIQYGRECLSLNHGTGIYSRPDTGTLDLEGIWEPGYGVIGESMQLYSDGTGQYIGSGRPFTWYTVDDTFVICPFQGRSYDYTVSGNTLTLFFSDGAEMFTRVGS